MTRTGKALRWAAGILGTVAALIAIAAVALYFLVTSDYLRGQLESRASDFSGRKTRIAKVAVDWGTTAHIHLEGVEVANASWAKADHMFTADQVDVDIRLWPLLRGNVVLPRVTLRKPSVSVETGDEDQSNWSFGESPVVSGAAQAVTPADRFQMPLVGRLEIVDGHLGYRDAKRKLALDGTFSTVTGKADADPQAELSIKGTLEKEPLAVHFVGGSAIMLRDTDRPYPVDLEVAYGATRLAVKGTLDDPIQWKGANVQLSLAGPNLADIYPLLGIPGPPTPPYSITGKLDREPGVWKFEQTTWHVGGSDLAGDILIDQRSKISHLTAKLVSQHLLFADLAPLVGASPGKTGNVSAQQKQTEEQLEANGDLFPDVPLQVERLRAMNMDVSLDAKHVVAPSYLPVTALAFRVVIDSGRATVQPLTLAMAGGSLTGELGIDARTDVPRVQADLKMQNAELKAFFSGSRFFDTTEGKLQGHVVLAGNGRSLAQIMGSADGNIDMAMAGGTVSSLMVSLAGLQIADALVLYITGDNRIPIGCAVGRLDFRHGDVVFDNTLLDTQKSVLHVDGQLALASQVVKVEIKANPKKFDLLDLHGPVVVEGKLRKPKISLARIIPIPTPALGGAKAIDCPSLTQQLLTGN
jgi:AsmA family protein